MTQVFPPKGTPEGPPQCPPVTDELLRFLRSKFPLEGFLNVKNEGELKTYQGAIDVITVLETEKRFQQEDQKKDT